MTGPDEDLLVDARGHHCPVPTLKLRRALEGAGGRVVRLLADDPMARIDVPHFVREAGAELVESTESDGVLTFRVRRTQV
ncbi:MAG: sulfurtransferase TusA family protein [Phenylobacterium sp.]|jgi:tRNA 2-thiouridine synthesizing protein A|uniref:sulfurtransferase TusA family protein n=1 Tax=Phenylobacterium sp. TaxID=1871053 RepID=UPI0025F044A4|nr:sulfurtransferase TusA family protein [Phenylobacterium sp.]MCA6297085.1 sulfurtransferase TusA family protein [Phenylobacterium sp.]MCA6300021.1 sulfurtransferase TusA family protein [Phenylobacterium sp.]